MQKIAVIQVSEAGQQVVQQLRGGYDATLIERSSVGRQWKNYDAFVFVGAMGVCVRTIAPYVKDKHDDPAVVCIDSFGQHVISVLSGHVGGANELASDIAYVIGGHPVITTQSDIAGLWALDTFEKRFDWPLASEPEDVSECVIAFVNRQPTALFMEVRDEGTEYLEATKPDHVTIIDDISEADPRKYKLLIIVSPFKRFAPTGMLNIHFVPMVGTIGFGLANHPDDYDCIYDEIDQAFADLGVLPCSHRYCTIDVKADEEFVEVLKYDYGETVEFFTAEQLAAVDVPNPSATVKKHVGTPSVCEAAAILGSDNGQLIIPKVKGEHWTAALAFDKRHLRNRRGHIEIVGAGPGDPELISLRGRRMLEKADLILYAGSLVPKALTQCAKSGATVRSSADMTLEEQFELMREHYDKGHLIVRLHTGDPCIYGAIGEQMALFDKHNMSYHITPGISSFQAAAAELQCQFTIPEECQTIILTRGEGRTAMPEREKLHMLAEHQSTMCIFLSATLVDEVQSELLAGGYPADTPVAVCHKLTWPEQAIYRGQLSQLAQLVHNNNLTLTTMIVVGRAIDNREGLSRLYSQHFAHLFRDKKE